MTNKCDDIVIAGISGRFPDCDSVDELRDSLFARKDLITEDDRRWPPGLYGLPTRSGKIRDLSRFDAQFFGLNPKQTDHMDPQSRLLLETTYEAIIDSGIHFTTLTDCPLGADFEVNLTLIIVNSSNMTFDKIWGSAIVRVC